MATAALTPDKAHQILAYGALGFGVTAILAPSVLRRSYGMTTESGELQYFGRMWGTRTAVLGAVAMAAQTDEDRRRLATLSAGMNGMDALVAATTRTLPARTRVMGALTSGAFAVVAAYGAAAG
jgi:hypothetical protein